VIWPLFFVFLDSGPVILSWFAVAHIVLIVFEFVLCPSFPRCPLCILLLAPVTFFPLWFPGWMSFSLWSILWLCGSAFLYDVLVVTSVIRKNRSATVLCHFFADFYQQIYWYLTCIRRRSLQWYISRFSRQWRLAYLFYFSLVRETINASRILENFANTNYRYTSLISLQASKTISIQTDLIRINIESFLQLQLSNNLLVNTKLKSWWYDIITTVDNTNTIIDNYI